MRAIAVLSVLACFLVVACESSDSGNPSPTTSDPSREATTHVSAPTANIAAFIATPDIGLPHEVIVATQVAANNPCKERSLNNTQFLRPPTSGWMLCSFGAAGTVMSKQLWMTEDRGVTWELINLNGFPELVGELPGARLGSLPPSRVDRMVFLDIRDGWMITGGPGPTLHKTHDGGRSWTSIQPPLGDQVTNILFENVLVGIVFTKNGKWRTWDGGVTWEVYDEQ